jgi:hypothetical protein
MKWRQDSALMSACAWFRWSSVIVFYAALFGAFTQHLKQQLFKLVIVMQNDFFVGMLFKSHSNMRPSKACIKIVTNQ